MKKASSSTTSKTSIKSASKSATGVKIVRKKTVATVPARKRILAPKKVSFFSTRGSKKLLKKVLLSKQTESGAKMFIAGLLVTGLLYGGYLFASTKFGNDVVISKGEILTRVGKVTTLPPGPPETIVRVQDPQSLRNQSQFFANVSEGDYVVMYPDRAIVYSLKNDKIVALKQIDNSTR